MSDRDRNISDEKKLLNLYIKYQRDYAGNQQFANLRGIAHENTLKVELFNYPYKELKGLDELELRIDKLKEKHKQKGRPSKKLEKEISQLNSELTKSNTNYEAYCNLDAKIYRTGKKPFWETVSKLKALKTEKTIKELNDYKESKDGFIELQTDEGIIAIEPMDVLRLQDDINQIALVFKIDNYHNDNAVINTIFEILSIYEDTDYKKIHKIMKLWECRCIQFNLQSEVFYEYELSNISKVRALKRVKSRNINALKIISFCIEFENVYGKKLSIQKHGNRKLKSAYLFNLFKGNTTMAMCEKVSKYSAYFK